MICLNYAEKVKNLNVHILDLYPLDIFLLCYIHYYLFSECEMAGLIRPSLENSKEYEKINILLQELNEYINKDVDINKYIEIVCRCTSIIYTFQPFYDGNTRTMLALQKILLNKKRLNFKINNWEIEKKSSPISTMFFNESIVSDKQLNKIKKRIY